MLTMSHAIGSDCSSEICLLQLHFSPRYMYRTVVHSIKMLIQKNKKSYGLGYAHSNNGPQPQVKNGSVPKRSEARLVQLDLRSLTEN
jgi:hypothetical protein